MWLLLLALIQAPDDAALRERIPALVQKLADDDVAARGTARGALFALPVRLVPDVLRAGEKAEDPEARAVLSEVRALAGWIDLLPGTIGEAKALLLRLQDRRNPQWARTQQSVLDGLRARPPAEATAALVALLDSPHDGLRLFALAGLVHHPPARAARLVPFLRDPTLGSSAVDAVLATGDDSVLPEILELFLAGGEGAHAAGQVLSHTGPGDAIDRVAEVARKDARRIDDALEILVRAGPAAEPAILGLFKVEHAEAFDLVEVLKRIGGPASIPAVRKYYETDDDPDSRDDVLFLLRDPNWAAERFDEARKDPKVLNDLNSLRLASRGGDGLRDRVLDWLRQPGLKVSVRSSLLPILGVSGREEDAPLLLEALKDPRLREEAAEALDMLGDPAHAGALLEALQRSRHPLRLHRMVLGLPAEAHEDAVLEILDDPEGYDDLHQRAAIALAGRRLTPRLKEALLRVVSDARLGRDERAGDALDLLCERVGPADLPRLAALRNHEDSKVQPIGLLLALRAGDPSAAGPLAAALSTATVRLYLGSDEYPFFDRAARAGPAWTEALLREWRKKTTWIEAAAWLASRDVREVDDALKSALENKDFRSRHLVERALGSRGDPEALERIMQRVLAGRNRMNQAEDDDRILAAAAGRERRARVLAAARVRGRNGFDETALRLAARMAIPEGLPLYREALRADQSDEDWEEDEDPVTAACVEAIVTLQAREAIPDLRRLLRSRQPFNRAAAAVALARLGDRGSVPLLVAFLDDPFEARNGDNRDDDEKFIPVRRVWHAAMEALEILSGQKAEGRSVAQRRASWKAWYEKHRDAFK